VATDTHIIDSTYFINEILIPGTENPNSGVCQLLCSIIDIYEEKYLTGIFGYAFYRYVIDTIAATAPDNVPQELIDLIDGVDYYDDQGCLTKWQGLRKHTAQFCYYWFYRTEMTQTTNYGQLIPKTENGAIVAASWKMSDAFNKSQAGARDCIDFLNANAANYPQWQSCGDGSDWFIRNLPPPSPDCGGDYMNVFGL